MSAILTRNDSRKLTCWAHIYPPASRMHSVRNLASRHKSQRSRQRQGISAYGALLSTSDDVNIVGFQGSASSTFLFNLIMGNSNLKSGARTSGFFRPTCTADQQFRGNAQTMVCLPFTRLQCPPLPPGRPSAPMQLASLVEWGSSARQHHANGCLDKYSTYSCSDPASPTFGVPGRTAGGTWPGASYGPAGLSA